jgi:hypothetical protein
MLVTGVEIDKDVNGCHENLGEDQNDDDPLEQLALCNVSNR